MNSDMKSMTADELEQLARDMRMASAGRTMLNAGALPASEAPGYQAMGSAPLPSSPQDPYAVTSWGETEYDFRTPSGQLCRMKKLRPEELLETGILDKVTRLPGFAEEHIQKAEGQPPTVSALPGKKEIQDLIEVLDKLIPVIVVKPSVHSVPPPEQERVPGVIYTDMIELGDRIAIMERAMTGVKRLDNFREQSGGVVSGVVDEPGHAMPPE